MTASRNRVRLGLCGTILEGSEEDLARNSAGSIHFKVVEDEMVEDEGKK